SAEAVRKRLEKLGYNCSFYIYIPGTIFPDHSHSADKIDVVLKGRFMIHMDGENGILRDGDYIFIPKGTVHRAAVVGDEDVVSIDAEKIL
ncbi:MAG: cupin domain-containing protein, partial [Gammaproteobacteria bacterium]